MEPTMIGKEILTNILEDTVKLLKRRRKNRLKIIYNIKRRENKNNNERS